MNIFASKTLAWWQVGILKLSILSIGIAAGAYWSELFLPYLTAFVAGGVVLGIYVAIVWLRSK